MPFLKYVFNQRDALLSSACNAADSWTRINQGDGVLSSAFSPADRTPRLTGNRLEPGDEQTASQSSKTAGTSRYEHCGQQTASLVKQDESLLKLKTKTRITASVPNQNPNTLFDFAKVKLGLLRLVLKRGVCVCVCVCVCVFSLHTIATTGGSGCARSCRQTPRITFS